MINTIKEAKQAADEAAGHAEDVKGYLADVEALIDAAGDLLSGAEPIEHDGEPGYFITGGALDDLRRTFREVE